MVLILTIFFAVPARATRFVRLEPRESTPGNAWLTDRDGEWLIGVQGGNQAEGDWPTFAKGQWVRRQASYGYGCACLRIVADPVTKDVKSIVSATARPLKACREDRALKEPKD